MHKLFRERVRCAHTMLQAACEGRGVIPPNGLLLRRVLRTIMARHASTIDTEAAHRIALRNDPACVITAEDFAD